MELSKIIVDGEVMNNVRSYVDFIPVNFGNG